MVKSLSRVVISGAFALALLLVGAKRADASLLIYLQAAGVNSGNIVQVGTGADFTAASFTGSYGDFQVNVFGGSSDNGATLSDLLSSTTSVQNNGTSTETLKIWVAQTGYTLPSGTPLNVESGEGGSINQGTLTLSGIFQAYADRNNDGLPASNTSALCGAACLDFTNGAQTGVPTGSTYDTGSATGTFNRILGSPYSLVQVTTFTLSAGGKANFSAHENLNPAGVPEPASLFLVGTGLFAASRRRFWKKA